MPGHRTWDLLRRWRCDKTDISATTGSVGQAGLWWRLWVRPRNEGLEPGCHADPVILHAADPVEAIRLRPARLHVIRRGKIISRTDPVVARLDLDGEQHAVTFRRDYRAGSMPNFSPVRRATATGG